MRKSGTTPPGRIESLNEKKRYGIGGRRKSCSMKTNGSSTSLNEVIQVKLQQYLRNMVITSTLPIRRSILTNQVQKNKINSDNLLRKKIRSTIRKMKHSFPKRTTYSFDIRQMHKYRMIEKHKKPRRLFLTSQKYPGSSQDNSGIQLLTR